VLDTVTRVNITGSTASGLLTPGQLILEAAAPAVYVEIPSDYQAIKAADARLALDWRLAVREMFEAHFQAGYVAVDFLSRQADGRRRSGYILQN
jgi:predicted GNAT superfamily acetyltransferase